MIAAQVLSPMPKLVVDDLDNADHYEILDGVRVELPPMSTDSQFIANRLTRLLSNYGIEHNIGEAYNETIFKLSLRADRSRRPDVAFVPYSRWPKNVMPPDSSSWEMLPDLCVEVVSPTDEAEELMNKVREYFQAGVRLVWVVYPRHELVLVFESLTNVRGLSRSDELAGGPVLAGFKLPLSEIFLPPAAPSE
jgi:Uma2 family endonuclease